MTKGLAFELAPLKIRVNCISPGLVQTEANREHWEKQPKIWANRSKGIPLRRTGQPSDIAELAYLLCSPAAAWITGVNYLVDGGMSIV